MIFLFRQIDTNCQDDFFSYIGTIIIKERNNKFIYFDFTKIFCVNIIFNGGFDGY
jgi:hypothetical protein